MNTENAANESPGGSARQDPQQPRAIDLCDGLILIKGEHFENETVCLTGRAWNDCLFEQCTIIVQGLPMIVVGCFFSNCRWVLDLIVFEGDTWALLTQNLFPLIAKSLPYRVPNDTSEGSTPPPSGPPEPQ